MRISGVRALLLGAVAMAVTTALVALGVVRAGPAPSAGSVAGAVAVVDVVDSLVVLRDWDRARARAWARGDPTALARLYAPRSRAGRRDVAMLRAWLRRGLRVDAMAMQVLDVELRARSPRRLVLVVTDRLVGASVRGRALPRDGPSTRRLVFRRVAAGRWVLVAARSAARSRASPAAGAAPRFGSASS